MRVRGVAGAVSQVQVCVIVFFFGRVAAAVCIYFCFVLLSFLFFFIFCGVAAAVSQVQVCIFCLPVRLSFFPLMLVCACVFLGSFFLLRVYVRACVCVSTCVYVRACVRAHECACMVTLRLPLPKNRTHGSEQKRKRSAKHRDNLAHEQHLSPPHSCARSLSLSKVTYLFLPPPPRSPVGCDADQGLKTLSFFF